MSIGVILSVLGTMALTSGSIDIKIMNKINKYNHMANCFSSELMAHWSLQQYKAVQFCNSIQAPFYSRPVPGIKPFQPAISTDQIIDFLSFLCNPAFNSLLEAGNSEKTQRWVQVNRIKRDFLM